MKRFFFPLAVALCFLALVSQADPKPTPRQKPKPSPSPGPVVIVGETNVTDANDPSAQLREALRKPAEGETQIMATLVKIECETRNNIVFVFKTSSGQLRLRTNKFEDIEITTFAAEVKGDIACGARKPHNVVVICYVPNTDKRVKADGVLKSVQFVPADFKLKPDKK